MAVPPGMTRHAWLVVLAVGGVLALGLGVGGLLENVGFVTVLGFSLGSLALSVAAACWLCSSAQGPGSRVATPDERFRVALLAALVPGVVLLVVAAFESPETAVSWGIVVGAVVLVGAGLALPLAVARTARQQWTAVTGLALLGELFVAAAVLDRNTHLEAEGLATLASLGFVLVATVVAIGVYVVGVTYGRADDVDPPRRPRLVAVAVPWPAGAAALTVPQLLDIGLHWLPQALGNPALYVYLALGGAVVAGAHVSMRPERATGS
jgi:hypothetical protein